MLGDFLQLMKPRILVLLVITCFCAMLVASGGDLSLVTWDLVVVTCLGLAVSAGGANAINMWFDQDIDKLMERTKKRPVPAGRLSANTALVFGVLCGVVSFAALYFYVNPLTAYMSLSGYLFYVLIYTMLLKRRTTQNIVIGGAAGAFPPLVGWAAVQDELSLAAWAMFGIIFFWTPPHFWALALKKNTDYTKAKVPMLPVIKGEAETKLQIVYYLLILIPITLGMAIFNGFGFIYLVSAAVLGGYWLYISVQLMKSKTIELAMPCFKFSLYYLAFLFLAMVVDTFI